MNLLDLTTPELESFFKERGEPTFRARQIARHLYIRLTNDFSGMDDLPKDLRKFLANAGTIGNLKLETVQIGDGGLTRKALFRMPGGEPVETVLMIYPGRATVCVSVQAGCAMGCSFCATARLGFLRNLTSGQIVEQVLWAARILKSLNERPREEIVLSQHLNDYAELPDHLTNVVFMGMGEAFSNYVPWWRAVEQLHDPKGFNLGARSFTVSTVGLAPGIRRLADETLPINLAISLHAARDDLRDEMMPVNKGIPIQALLEAVREYMEKTNRRVSFEYLLIQEKNDSPEEADLLARVLKTGPLKDHRTLVHVNLIPWNPVPGSPLQRSHRKRVLAFQEVLQKAGVPCTVRVERGQDIAAACGQLAGGDLPQSQEKTL